MVRRDERTFDENAIFYLESVEMPDVKQDRLMVRQFMGHTDSNLEPFVKPKHRKLHTLREKYYVFIRIN